MLNYKKHIKRAFGLLSALLILFAAVASAPKSAQAEALAPLQFVSGGHALAFDADGFHAASGSHALRVDFLSANEVQPQADSIADGQPAPLQRVTYPDLWPGTVLTYDAPEGVILRSTYILAPGANPGDIRLRYNAPLAINEDGSLSISFASGSMTESAPIAWQEIRGQRVPVDVRFAVSPEKSPQTVSFAVGAHDPRYSLTIDPGLTWNTFLGGGADDYSRSIALDADGNIYVTGNSAEAWTCALVACTVNPYTGDYDAFVAKLDGTTGDLLWNTFLGGAGLDDSMGIAVDNVGNVYVSGYSTQTWGTPLRDFGGGSADGFTAKLDAASGTLTWHTFLGGTEIDRSWGVAVDGTGNVYVTGNSIAAWSCSPVACTVGTFNGMEDAFTAKLDSSGALQWNTFLGGAGTDVGYGLTVDGGGNIYISGYSTETWGAPPQAHSGDSDGFAAKLNSSGALTWNTFLGGAGTDLGYGISLDAGGSIYVAGTSYADWGAPLRAFSGGLADGFAAKLDGTSGALTWHTFLGGTGYDYVYGIVVDGAGSIYLAGASDAAWGYPLRDYTAELDGFAAKLSPTGRLMSSAFLGGIAPDKGYGIAVYGNAENVFVSGYSSDAWGTPVRDYTGGKDTFVAKVDLTPPIVGSIVLANASPTNATSVSFTVTFSEPVTGVDETDFVLDLYDISGAAITGLTGSEDVYTVTVSTGNGNGFIRLDVLDDDSIVNAESKPLGGVDPGNGDFTHGQEYIITKTAPVLIFPRHGTNLLTNRFIFDWSNYPGATSYQIQASKSTAFTLLAVSGILNGATNSQYTLTRDLTANTTLYWRVRARLGRTYSAWSNVATIYTANPPSLPVLVAPLNNTLVSGPTVLFNWNNSTVPVGTVFDHYQLQISTNNTFTALIHNLNIAGVDNSQDDTAVLNPATTYYWRVRSFNAEGEYSAWTLTRSLRIKFITPIALSPGVDVPDAAPNTHMRRPTFVWEPVPGAKNYTVEVSTLSTFASKAINATATTTFYTHTADLSANTTYYWRVRANGTYGPSAYSSPVKTFQTGNPPDVPTLSKPLDNTLFATNTVMLDWNTVNVPISSPAFYKYEVQVASDSLFTSVVQLLDVPGINTTEVLTTPFQGGLTYYWRVRSVNVGVDTIGGSDDDDYSGWSLSRRFRIVFDGPVLLLPANGDINVDRKPTFTWEAIPGATSYTFQVSTSTAFTVLAVNRTVLAPNTSYVQLVNLLPNTVYYWRVRANGTYGPGAWQTVVFSFTTGP